MISKILFQIAIMLFLGTSVFAGALFQVKGRVLRIEDGKAVIKSASGETRVPLKKLSKVDHAAVMASSGSKKDLTLSLPPQILEQETP